MADASIALNRFGLGGRPGEAVPSDPERYLLNQLDRFEVRPAPIADLPSTREVAADLADYLAEVRGMRLERRDQPPERQPGLRKRGLPADAAMGMADAAQAMTRDSDADSAPDAVPDPEKQARQFVRRQGRDFYAAAVTARADAALVSPAPFVERLVHFWANHFAVSADKVTMVGLAGTLEFDAIRPHVLGTFRDMLHAVERHPAMLLYLDQAQSVGPMSPAAQFAAQRRARRPQAANRQMPGLNENLGREILELHTLGVRTGYTQEDVTEFARALTGWSVAGLSRGPLARLTGVDGEPGAFVFAPQLHEPGGRTILGKRFDQQGERQAAAVLDMLATHPATAKHIATKLARHFAGDEPPPRLVGRLEAAFLRTGGDLVEMYRVLIGAPECWVARPVKFKTPWEWSISAMRALGTRELKPMAMVGLLNQLGQPVWKPGSPAGWDDIAASWAGPDAIMRRVEAAERMAQRTRDTIDARARAAELFPGALSRTTEETIARAESPGQGVALMLVSPEFMRR